MRALLAALGDPHDALEVLHVAGTKGKGSTCAFAAAMLRAAGLRVGLTTSPHLSCARERIVIDDELISEADFALLGARVQRAATALERSTPGDGASFFEKMIALAFLAFREARVDVAVVEVGLGGRLDATNVVAPRACAITRLGIDHTEYLGPTLEHIAREKAGILKPGVPAVTVLQEESAAAVVEERARAIGSALTVVSPTGAPLGPALADAIRPTLAGAHQRENALLAAALVRAAALPVTDLALIKGAEATFIPGRYERLRGGSLLIDGAHNPTAAEALARALAADPALRGRALELVVGMTTGHDPTAFAAPLAALPFCRVTAVPTRSPRTQPADAVARALSRTFVAVEEGLLDEVLTRGAPDGGVTVVTGSLYLVGEVRSEVLGVPTDPQFPLF